MSAGKSHRLPLFGSLLFGDQSSVDQFVAQKNNTKSLSTVSFLVSFLLYIFSQTCSDFKAGNMLRSANRFNALDETAVFGCCCRHDFPVNFINLKHGER